MPSRPKRCDQNSVMRVDLRPEIAVGGIERIVEIEHPGVDMRERAYARMPAPAAAAPPESASDGRRVLVGLVVIALTA